MTVNIELEQAQSFLNYFKTLDATVYSYTIDATDAQNLFVTDSIEIIFGLSKLEFNMNTWKKFVHPQDRNKVNRWRKLVHSKLESGVIQYRITHSDGSIRWLEDHLTVVTTIESQNVFLGIIIDITAKKEYEQQIEYMAFNDTLTGLPNRNMLSSYFPKAIARCKRKNTKLAIMYIDLDKFKNVNDTFGHDIGDLLLKQVAQRLLECVRQGDIVTRQGGDEFVILLEDTNIQILQEIAKRILVWIAEPFIIEMEKISVSASIGISIYPEHGEDLDTLTRLADEAMFECKASSIYQFYK